MWDVDVRVLKNYGVDDDKIDLNRLDGVIQIDDHYQTYWFAEIQLTGRYNRKYTFLSNYSHLKERSVCIDGDLMVVAICCAVLFYDLKEDKTIKVVDVGTWTEDCLRLGNGYFVHGELTNFFFDKNFEVAWTSDGADIFENMRQKDVVEVGKGYVAVLDWVGVKRYYNESGCFKSEYMMDLDMNVNTKWEIKKKR